MSDKEKEYELYEDEEEKVEEPVVDENADIPYVSYREKESLLDDINLDDVNPDDILLVDYSTEEPLKDLFPEESNNPVNEFELTFDDEGNALELFSSDKEEQEPVNTFELPEEENNDLLEEFSIGEEQNPNVFVLPDETPVSEGIVFLHKETDENDSVSVNTSFTEEEKSSDTEEIPQDEIQEDTTSENEVSNVETNEEALVEDIPPKKSFLSFFSFLKKKRQPILPMELHIEEETPIPEEEEIINPSTDNSENDTPFSKDFTFNEATPTVSLLSLEKEQKEEPVEDVDFPSSEEENSIEDSTVEVIEQKDEPVAPAKKKSKNLIYIIGGGLVAAVLVSVLFSPKGDGGSLIAPIKNLFIGSDTVELADPNATVPTPVIPQPTPVEVTTQPPVEEPTEPVIDPMMVELQSKLKPVFEAFGGYVDSVDKTEDKIVVKGTIKNDYLLEVNRLVRSLQIESFPYLNGSLGSVQVELHKGKTMFTYDTSKEVIDFIQRLHYEDRHSSQLWWRKTTAIKNGRNIKASQVKDRLYVEYIHPIYPASANEQPADPTKAANPNTDADTGAETGSEADKQTKEAAKDEYLVYENNQFGLFFEHPSTVEIREYVESNKVLHVERKDKKALPIGFKVQTSKDPVDVTGTDEEKLSKLFAQKTFAIEDEHPEYTVLEKAKTLNNFVDQEFKVRTYFVKDGTQSYYLFYGLALVDNRAYEFFVTQETKEGLDAELLFKSSNLGDGGVVAPTVEKKTDTTEKTTTNTTTPSTDTKTAPSATTTNGN